MSTMTHAVPLGAIRRIDETMVEIAESARPDMRVPARIFADEALWEQIARDRMLDSLYR